ncbi:MAG: YciE/YciF ferroxidase family protein [Solirubrobacteraceae bacterium]|jgi:ferritin-like metal-binding protein YciE
MFERLHTPEETYNWQLGAALKMEKKIVGMLDELIDESHDESIKQLFRTHQQETKGQIENIEQAFSALGWEVDESPCPAIEGIEKEGKATIKKTDDAIVDSVILEGAMETEHHEMAVYENLIINARAMGRDDVAQLMQRNLDQEQHALQKVKTLAEQVATVGAA